MKEKNNITIQLGAAVLGVIVTTALVAGATYAQVDAEKRKGDCEMKCEKRFERQENRDAIRLAIENNDYEAWLAAHPSDAPMLEKISEENFSKLVEMHNLMQVGDKEGANEIREELGLERKVFGKFKHKKANNKNREAIRLAIENNDYEAWLAAHPEGCPMADSLTEENFAKLVQAHELRVAGDKEGAREIMEEIGFGHEKQKRGMRR